MSRCAEGAGVLAGVNGAGEVGVPITPAAPRRPPGARAEPAQA